MHRTKALSLLQQHLAQGLDAHEESMVRTIIAFVEAKPDCFLRSCLEGHLTGSAWITDKEGKLTLLTHHRKLNKWLQLGGHADGETDPLNVARKEADEESGLSHIEVLDNSLFDVDSHWIPARGEVPAHWHHDLRFWFLADPAEAFVVSEESLDLAWVEVDKVETLNPEESMLRMVRKTQAQRSHRL